MWPINIIHVTSLVASFEYHALLRTDKRWYKGVTLNACTTVDPEGFNHAIVWSSSRRIYIVEHALVLRGVFGSMFVYTVGVVYVVVYGIRFVLIICFFLQDLEYNTYMRKQKKIYGVSFTVHQRVKSKFKID